MAQSKITWTHTDEAPALATKAFLPVLEAFMKNSGVEVEIADISLAGRIIANFPDKLTDELKAQVAEAAEQCENLAAAASQDAKALRDMLPEMERRMKAQAELEAKQQREEEAEREANAQTRAEKQRRTAGVAA